MSANGQAESRSPKLASHGFIRLSKGLKYFVPLIRSQAQSSIHDRKTNHDDLVRLFEQHRLKAHLPTVREFDGVAEEVKQYLLQLMRVTLYEWMNSLIDTHGNL